MFSCNNDSDLKEVQVLFAPSFLHPTKFSIDVKNKTIEQYTFQNSYYEKEWIDSTSYREHKKDTLVVHYQNTFPIDNKTLNKFLSELKETQLDSTIKHYEPILDGIGYRISKISLEKDTISLTSNISSRNEKSKIEYKLLDAFFELSNKTINDYEGNYIIESIQGYLSYGETIKKLKLKIEKISENPIEYRLWGELNGCKNENDELLTFLKNLPEQTPVIFDLKKGSFSSCLDEVISEYQEKKDIYFYGGDEIYFLDEYIKSVKEELELKKNGKEKSEEEKAIELLLDSESKPLNELLTELHLKKQRLNNNKIFLTKDEVIKTIANTSYK